MHTDPLCVQQLGAARQPDHKRSVVLVVTALGLTIAGLVIAFAQGRTADPLPRLAWAVLALVAALSVSVLVIRARAEPGLRAAWCFLAAGSTIYLLTTLPLVTTLPLIRGERLWPGQPNPLDWLSLSCGPLLVIGVLQLVLHAEGHASYARLDGAILILASAAVLTAAWQKPAAAWDATSATLFNLASAAIYVLLVSIMGAATFSARFQLSPAGTLAWSGILVWGFGEVSIVNQTVGPPAASTGSFVFPWLLGFLLLAAAGIAPARPSTSHEVRQWSARAPAFAALLAGAVLVVGLIHAISTLATLLAVAALLLTVVRQFTNLAELDRAHRMHDEARTDDLTGLLNRRGLYEILTSRLASQPDVALLMVDLDEFKEINDSLGHQAGDEMLIVVADRLRQSCPATAAVARLGGDEFAIAVMGPADPEELARTILSSLSAPAVVHDTPVRVSASIGISSYPHPAGNLDELLRTADVAMYMAKRDRCVICIYRAELDPHSGEQLHLLDELRCAIPAGQLVVLYQPQCRLSDGVITSVEALLRWEHPTRGQLLPSKFIRQAESSGVICELTNYVLDRALSDLRTWLDAGADIGLSVNISGVDLARLDLPDVVSRALDRSDVTPQRLTLELAETVITSDASLAKRMVVRLQSLGVRVAMDDFGIGFNSLAQALSLPLDEIKLDHSLIAAAKEPKGRAILRTAVRLARAVGASVVAEGVEDLRSLNLLRSLGADYAQGYLICRPVPSDEVVACAGTVPPALATSLAVVSKPYSERVARHHAEDDYRTSANPPLRGAGPSWLPQVPPNLLHALPNPLWGRTTGTHNSTGTRTPAAGGPD